MSDEEASTKTNKSGTAVAEKPKDPFNRPAGPNNSMPDCLCGCGQGVASIKSGFLPGHDAKLHSLFNKMWSGEDGIKIPTIAQPHTAYFEERWHKDQVMANAVEATAKREAKEAEAAKTKAAEAEKAKAAEAQ